MKGIDEKHNWVVAATPLQSVFWLLKITFDHFSPLLKRVLIKHQLKALYG